MTTNRTARNYLHHRNPAAPNVEEPYTPAERAQLYGLVHDAALGDPGEANEPMGLTPAESLAVNTLRDAVRRETAAALRPLLAGTRQT